MLGEQIEPQEGLSQLGAGMIGHSSTAVCSHSRYRYQPR